jgi:hypothetical protein
MRASEFIGTVAKRNARVGSRHQRGHTPLPRYRYSNDQKLDELSFLGSECTKDCSGHRAGYDWYKKRGYEPASWSNSFNRGAALAAAGK